MKTIRVPHGLISISNSDAQCPHCQKSISVGDVEDKLIKSENKNKGYIRFKCKGCTRYIGVAMAYNGEVQSFELNKLKNHEHNILK